MGRKRHLLVDTQGFALKVVVSAADVQDRDGARLVAHALQVYGPELPRLSKGWADGGYSGPLADEVRQQLGWEMEIVKRSDTQPTGPFAVQPHRWIVERIQPQYLQSALDVQASLAHDRAHRVAKPACSGHSSASGPAGMCICSTGSGCAMSLVPSQSEHLVSAPPRPRARRGATGAIGGSCCHRPIGNGSCICSVASSNGS